MIGHIFSRSAEITVNLILPFYFVISGSQFPAIEVGRFGLKILDLPVVIKISQIFVFLWIHKDNKL